MQVPRMTPEETDALKIAREMIDAGIPIFAAAPNPDRPGQYYLPREWQRTEPDPTQLERWQPGWALGAVGGGPADFLDFDPRNGGDQSLRELEIQKQVPRAFGVQSTPSGGTHLIISPTGERKAAGFMPGVDLQSGGEVDEHGSRGRGFVYIAPTVRPSKAPETLGQLRGYRWEQPPDLAYLAEFARGADDTLDGILARVHTWRGHTLTSRPALDLGSAGSQLFARPAGDTRAFSLAEAQAFCLPHLEALERAQIGSIEECANRAAVALAHFVPHLWSADTAFDVLMAALKQTAYNPQHPASGWSAEKFRAVLDGRRPPLDGWKAVKRDETAGQAAETVAETDAVDALIAEMRKPADIIAQEPPRPLIKGLLNLDSESWIIGEPGSKKSFVATDMAAHVALGIPWQGMKVHQGGVVMIVAEGGGGLGPRLKAWEAEHGAVMSDRVDILPRPVQAIDVGAWAVLREACRRLAPALVVIDTQARVTVGLEENSAKEMGVYIEAVRSIREATGACVLTVHHTGRRGGDARGSSAIDGAQHTELKVEAADSLRGQLVSEKQKDMALGVPVPLVFKIHTVGVDEDGEPITSLALAKDVWRALADSGELPSAEEEWIAPVESVRELVLRVLADHGEDRGVTSAQARKIVIERFYGGVPARLKEATWRTSWNRAIKHESVICVGGERFTLDRLAG